MTNHPNRSQACRKRAEAAGYYVREGSYRAADRRWCVGRKDDRSYDAGYRTQREAWEAAAKAAAEEATNADP